MGKEIRFPLELMKNPTTVKFTWSCITPGKSRMKLITTGN